MDFKINYSINVNRDMFSWIIHVSIAPKDTGQRAMSLVQSLMSDKKSDCT